MLDNLLYLVVSTAALIALVKSVQRPAAAIVLGVILICIVAVSATLSRDTADLVSVIEALTTLLRVARGG